MKKKLVSLLSLILAVVMICPTMVFADETETTTPPAFAIKYNGETCTKNQTFTIYTNSTKNTIDFDVDEYFTNVHWSSSQTSVATVDVNTGVVTAVSAGNGVVITAFNGDNSKTFTCKVNVVVRNVESTTVTAEPTNKNYVSGQKFDPSGMKVTFKYNDTGDEVVDSFTLKDDVPLVAGQEEVVVKARDLEFKIDGLNVIEKSVSAVEVIDATKNYTEGDSISGVKLKVSYNDDTSIEMTSGFDVSINRPLAVSDNNATVTVTYGGKSATFTIKVEAAETETNPPATNTPTTATYDATVYTKPTKLKYTAGEAFDPTGMVLKITKTSGGTTTTATLNSFTHVAKNVTATDIANGYVDVSITYIYDGAERSDTVRVSTITNNTDDSEINTISSVELKDDEYPVGYSFSKTDIYEIKLKFYGDSSSTTLDYDELDGYDFYLDSDFEIEVLTTGGSRKSNNRTYLEDSNVTEDDDGDKTANLRLYYTNYNGSEKYINFTVSVGESDIAYYYEDDLIAIYEELEDALDYTLEDDDDWTSSFEVSDVEDDEAITLKLGKDYKISSDYEEFSPQCNVIIDLNGHDLRFYSDTIVVDRDDDDYTVTITNSSKTEADFTYYDKDITITLGEDDKFVFEYDSDADDDYLPGIVTVTASAGTGGRITASPSLSSSGTVDVGMGSDIKFTITPEKDYAVDVIKVNSKTVSTTNNENYSISSTGVVTYTLEDVDANTKVEVTFKETKKEWENPFTDVRESASYYSAVEFVYTNELFKGTTDTKFAPNTTMTRAMFVTVLGRLAGVDVSDYRTSSFTDVPYNSSTSWYAPYVEWAVEYGIVQGYGDGTFGPNNEITHQQMYVMMYRYSMFVENNQVNVRNVALTMSDRNDVADWATDAVKYAQQNDFLVLDGNKVDPTGDALRWELATLLESFCETVLNWAE